MADLSLLEKALIVCESAKCKGTTTWQKLIEAMARGKPPVRAWICTVCYAKSPAVLPISR